MWIIDVDPTRFAARRPDGRSMREHQYDYLWKPNCHPNLRGPASLRTSRILLRFHGQQFFMRQSSQRKLHLSIHFVVFWRALAHADGAIVLSQLEMLAKWPIRSPYVISDFRIVSRPPFEMKEAAI